MINVLNKKIIVIVMIVAVILFLILLVGELGSGREAKQWCFENKGQVIENQKGKKGVDINIKNIEHLIEKKEIVVGVIDSGIDFSSEVLKSACFINEGEIAGNKIDDDNNGYIDDVSGWNFYDNTSITYSNYTSDFHGTTIAGIIAGNTVGNIRFGVSTSIKVLPLKCFRGTKGDISDVVQAIEYGYNMGVRIFNCSWDTMVFDEELYAIMKKYQNAIFVCSGGKTSSNLTESPIYPACFELDNVICVGGINNRGDIYQFSGYGEEIDVYAPSKGIYCVMPDNTFAYSEGTSLATAFVTGAVALVYSPNVDITADSICEMFRGNEKINRLNIEAVFNSINEKM